MPRTTAGVRTGPSSRLDTLAGERPEWRTWIRLLQVAWSTLDPGNRNLAVEPSLAAEPSSFGQRTPLLAGSTLRVDAKRAAGLLSELASVAFPDQPRYPESGGDALRLIAGAMNQDLESIATLAVERGLDPGALVSLANLAALPLLQSCGRTLKDQLPAYWDAGFCPLCGAWPILAERRGLDRSRRLRCGRCAADWEVQWLYCIYCGEREHTRLGTLVAADSGETLKVETCATCQGYLKSLASLQSFPPLELLLRDLETLELDLIALERGYQRPGADPSRLQLRIVNASS